MNDIAETTDQSTETAETNPTPRGRPTAYPSGQRTRHVRESRSQWHVYTVDLQHLYKDGDTWEINRSFKVTDMRDVMKQAAAAEEKVKELTRAPGQAR